MPDLNSEDLYRAARLLVAIRRGEPADRIRLQRAWDALQESPYKNAADYALVVNDIRNLLEKGE